jgi:hypothetical protein
MSNVLIYRQTHPDDPGDTGVFGINDCMGQVRGWDFDYVIATLGKQVSWVGIDARKIPWAGHAPQVIFKRFLSILPAWSYPIPPNLAKVMPPHQRLEPLIQTKTPLSIDIRNILKLAINAPPSKGGISKRKICPMRDDQDAELPGVVSR